jgi:chaperone BCS1
MGNLSEFLDLQTLIIASLTFTVAGILGFWCKDVPIKIWKFALRQLTTSIYITTAHMSFFTLMEWIAYHYKDKNFRDFKINNGRWGNDDISFTLGYGGHFIRYRRHLFYVSLERKDSQGVERDKEVITIQKFGRSRKIFDEFIKEITDPLPRDHIEIYQLNHDYWNPRGELPGRPMSSVFIEADKREALLTTLDNFIASENWYVSHGIPYQLGILLHGHPGTGKSSLIKAIASYLKYDIYYLSASQLYKLENGLESLPRRKSILVIEDIDCDASVHKRKKADEPTELTPVPTGGLSLDKLLTVTNLSDVLNLLDGLCATHGRILIMTTNHVDKLDPALIRPGRIDHKVEVGYVNLEILDQFTESFYRERTTDIKVKPGITCADLQNMVLQEQSYETIINNIKEEE